MKAGRAGAQSLGAFIRIHGLPVMVLLLGLGGTYIVWNNASRDATRLRQAEFEFRVDEIIGSIGNRFLAHEQILRGVAGLFRASNEVDRSQFRAYAAELKLDHAYPGIQSIGYAVRIPAEGLKSHIEQVRGEGFPEYDIWPADLRETYSSLVYIEPFSGRNLRAFGFDMFTEPTRRAAMERARDHNASAISGRVELAQEDGIDVQPGFVMYLPVYPNRLPHATLADRRAHIAGWVGASFRMKDLMQGVLRHRSGEIRGILRVRMFDGPSPDSLMYDSESGDSGAWDAVTTAQVFRTLRGIELAGRQWTLEAVSAPAFHAQPDDSRLPWIAGSGAATSLLLTLLVAQLTLRHAHAETAAADRGRELVERRQIEDALRASEERFRDLARKDVLTGLSSPRAFREEAAMLIKLAARTGVPSALAFLDLDDFKLVNDTMGHAEGDRVLQCIGEALAKSTRSTDLVGRLGGDEFVVLLPEAEAASAKLFFDRLHEQLLELMRDHGWPVGVSMGVAFFPTAPPSADDALHFADSVMYMAKKAGKNRTATAEFPSVEQRPERSTPANSPQHS
ncbi:MAG: CHASE domain-containing protein [Burkholderiaceae bacterium]|nr:CHASE domain-containing protein [Burkholderiaceae bacterium]